MIKRIWCVIVGAVTFLIGSFILKMMTIGRKNHESKIKISNPKKDNDVSDAKQLDSDIDALEKYR